MTRGRYALLAAVLGLLPMLLPLSVDGSLAMLPALGAHFASPPSVVQLSLSAVVAGIAAGQLFYGPLSDAVGRKPVILGGLAAYLAATAVCAASTSVEMLVASRFLQGFFACSGVIVARAVIRDLFDREDGARLFALMMGVHGVMPMVAPGVSGWIGEEWGWRTVFAVMAAFSALVAVAVLAGLRETLPAGERSRVRLRPLAGAYLQILSNREFRANTACSCFLYASLFAYFVGAPVGFIRFLGLGPAEFGAAMAVPMLAYVITQMTVARMIHRLGLDRLVRIGTGIAIAAGTAMVLFVLLDMVDVYTLTGPITFILVAHAFIVPTITVGAIAPFAHSAGAASSLLGFIQFLAAAAMTAVMGMLDDGTPLPMAAAICICSFGVLLVYLGPVRSLPGRGAS